MNSIKSKTIEELMNIFDVVFDSQDHPIFTIDNEFYDNFYGYDEAFGRWIAYELITEDDSTNKVE